MRAVSSSFFCSSCSSSGGGEVHVIVNEAGEDELALQIEDARVAFADDRAHVGERPNLDDALAADGYRAGFRLVGLDRPDPSVHQDELGGVRRLAALLGQRELGGRQVQSEKDEEKAESATGHLARALRRRRMRGGSSESCSRARTN